MLLWTFQSRAGLFAIVPGVDGGGTRFSVFFEDENLGSYASAMQALDDLIGGHASWPSCGDPSELGLPEAAALWMI